MIKIIAPKYHHNDHNQKKRKTNNQKKRKKRKIMKKIEKKYNEKQNQINQTKLVDCVIFVVVVDMIIVNEFLKISFSL